MNSPPSPPLTSPEASGRGGFSLAAGLRRALFASPGDALLSVVLLALLAWVAFSLLGWATTRADWAVVRLPLQGRMTLPSSHSAWVPHVRE